MEHSGEQHHPIRVYLVVWGLLFLLSIMSYLVDLFEVRPKELAWFLITAFALLKAGLIVSYFMHVRFERLSLVYAILLPPLLIVALTAFVMAEGGYVFDVRALFFGR
ncbi:MAG: cytochrome C oxidase subunit IV family protein [Candidatus Bipolaricaulota bacterium]|nr:cytochrome C oxidase subunit IV family protein [Candidatus Bipolaricaulota bacterium]